MELFCNVRYLLTYQEPMPVEQLVCSLCDLKQMYTQIGGKYYTTQYHIISLLNRLHNDVVTADDLLVVIVYKGNAHLVFLYCTWAGIVTMVTSCIKVIPVEIMVDGKLLVLETTTQY